MYCARKAWESARALPPSAPEGGTTIAAEIKNLKPAVVTSDAGVVEGIFTSYESAFAWAKEHRMGVANIRGGCAFHDVTFPVADPAPESAPNLQNQHDRDVEQVYELADKAAKHNRHSKEVMEKVLTVLNYTSDCRSEAIQILSDALYGEKK